MRPRLWLDMKPQGTTLDAWSKMGKKERAVKHWTIAASAGNDQAMEGLDRNML
jgi:hypothetical protein